MIKRSPSRLVGSIAALQPPGGSLLADPLEGARAPRRREMMLSTAGNGCEGKRSLPTLHPTPLAPPYSQRRRSVSQNRSGTSDSDELATIYEPPMATRHICGRGRESE